MVDALLQDVRHALRHLRRSPGFALAAVLTLAFGIGANTATFSVLNALVLRTLPVQSPSELVWAAGYGSAGARRLTLITALEHLEADPGPLRGYCAVNNGLVLPVEANGAPLQATVDFMTAGCLQTLGLVPALGRLYTAEEAPLATAGARVALIRHRVWQNVYGGDPGVIGRRIRGETADVEIIGVLPPAYEGLNVDSGSDIVAPFGALMPKPPDRPFGATYIIGRLRPGATIEQARAHLAARWSSLVETVMPPSFDDRTRRTYRDVTIRAGSLANGFSGLRDRFLLPLQVSFALTGVLLVLMCVNLGGLLLSRLAARQNEIAVRRAVGATRARLVQQLASESLLIALAGTAAGLPLAWVLTGAIEALLPSAFGTRILTFSPDERVLTISVLAGLATGVIISLVPVLSMTFGDHGAAGWSRTIAGGTTRRNKALVIAQVTLCCVLVVGAGLLSRSLVALQRVDTGLQTQNLLMVRLNPVMNGYQKLDAASYYGMMLERVAALPSVRAVGYARMFPHLTTAEPLLAPIWVEREPGRETGAQFDIASPRFFETVGIRLIRGRQFDAGDDARGRRVAIVNEQLARQLAANGHVIGTRVSYGPDPARQNLEIVGVVSNATLGSFRATVIPILYLSAAQAGTLHNYPTLQIAVDGDHRPVAEAVARIVRDMGREYVHVSMRLDEYLDRSVATERMAAIVANATALLGLLLALIGIYALLAYAVARRKRELGVRLAIGATPRSVRRLVVREGAVLMLIGTAIGVPLSVWPARALQPLLYGVTPVDVWTLTGTALFLVAVGVAAAFIPARRASRVDPMVALRAE